METALEDGTYDRGGVARQATAVARTRTPGARAAVVALIGELGAGKTTFAQALAGALGVTDSVTSPTYVIEKIYPLKGQRFARLVHIDAYRLESPEELAKLDWEHTAADPANLILIEWADKVEALIPKDALRIHFSLSPHATDAMRTIHYAYDS